VVQNGSNVIFAKLMMTLLVSKRHGNNGLVEVYLTLILGVTYKLLQQTVSVSVLFFIQLPKKTFSVLLIYYNKIKPNSSISPSKQTSVHKYSNKTGFEIGKRKKYLHLLIHQFRI
jgi:hypothetical protein